MSITVTKPTSEQMRKKAEEIKSSSQKMRILYGKQKFPYDRPESFVEKLKNQCKKS